MKRSPIRRGAVHWKKALDILCREVVMARDKKCQWCGKSSGLQWCHVRSRRYLSTRWHLQNSLILCSGCHLKWHHQPLAAAEWFKASYPARHTLLGLFDSGATEGKLDRELIRLELEQALKRLT